MANSLDATVTLAPHSAPLDKANGRRRICLRNDAAELDFPPKATEGGPQVSKRMRNEDISRSRLRLRGYRVEGRLGLDLSPAKSRLRTIRAMIPERVVRHD